MEEWRPIKQSRGQYEVSSLGRVRNIRTGRILKSHPKTKGSKTMTVTLHGFMRGSSYTVAKLMMMGFYPEETGRAGHYRDVTDNRIENIRIIKHGE